MRVKPPIHTIERAAVYPPTEQHSTINRPFDSGLSRDLENIDIALQGNPPRFERIWLRISKRILESRIPDVGVR